MESVLVHVCMWAMLMSLCGPKASVKATGQILFTFSQNLYFRLKWIHKSYFENFLKSTFILAKSLDFSKKDYLLPGCGSHLGTYRGSR